MAALLSNGLSVRRPPSSSAVFRLRRCGLLLGSAASLIRKEGPESEKVIDLSRKSGVLLAEFLPFGL